MRKSAFTVIIFFMSYITAFSQTSDDSGKIFDDSQLGRADITIDPAKLQWIYANPHSDSEHVASIRFTNKYFDEIIDSIGFRLRGNTSRDAKKKSFKISFNSFTKGKKFHGVEKLNFNGEHNDPSVIRSKLCFNHFSTIGMKASRASHIDVYINGQYYGLYINVEHIDEEFLKKNYTDDTGNLWKCLYPADLKDLGDDPNKYKNLLNNGTPAYELSTNESAGDFNSLVRLVKVINRTSADALPDSIESLFSLTELFKYEALNLLVGSWDEYWSLMNNYYLYFEPQKGMFHLIPYDYDNTFGVDWFNVDWSKVNPYSKTKAVSGSRPLIEKLITNAQYRNLYTHFLEFYRSNVYDLNLWDAELERLRVMIAGSVAKDPYYPLDYGFTAGDFFNSFSSTGYTNKHVKTGIRQFVNQRNASLPAQLSYLSAKPFVYEIDYLPKYPSKNDSIFVTVSAFSKAGIKDVSIYYTETGTTADKIYQMKFNPVHNTKKVEESDRYTGVIPPLGAGKNGKFLIYITDNENQTMIYPRKGAIALSTSGQSSESIVINEFLADNKNSTPDPSGEHDDWVELYNNGTKAVKLTGKYLTDDPLQLNKWKFTKDSLSLKPGEVLVVWCDDQETQPGIHANFKLSKSGEYIAIVDSTGLAVIDSISFGAQSTDISMGRYPDGSNTWKFLPPTPGTINFVTNVDNKVVSPMEYRLDVYPNPFNPTANIQFNIVNKGLVTLKIYDVLGREVSVLLNEEKLPGNYSVQFNGSGMASGLYFCRLTSGNYEKTEKLQLLK